MSEIPSIPIPNEIAAMLAGPTSSTPKCPECGGRLTVNVTIYSRGPVELERWPDGKGKLRHGTGITETKKALVEQTDENYAGAQVDEREEVRCDNCEWWCHPVELER